MVLGIRQRLHLTARSQTKTRLGTYLKKSFSRGRIKSCDAGNVCATIDAPVGSDVAKLAKAASSSGSGRRSCAHSSRTTLRACRKIRFCTRYTWLRFLSGVSISGSQSSQTWLFFLSMRPCMQSPFNLILTWMSGVPSMLSKKAFWMQGANGRARRAPS